MVHKEETLVCPSVKYADQISQCKQIHCKDCREKEKQHSNRIEALEKKLKVMTIVGAVAATAVGKDLLDKIIASFDKVQEVQKKIDEASNTASNPSTETSKSRDTSKENPLVPVEQTSMGNPYSDVIDGEHSAFVTSLSTPYPMDPSMASVHHSPYFDWNPSVVLGASPTTVLSHEMMEETQQTSKNGNLVYEFQPAIYIHDDQLVRTSLSNFANDFTIIDDGTPTNYGFFTVPSPATISLLIPCLCMARRSR